MLVGGGGLEAAAEGVEAVGGDGLVVGSEASAGAEAAEQDFLRGLHVDEAWLDAEAPTEAAHGVALVAAAESGVDHYPVAVAKRLLKLPEKLPAGAHEDLSLAVEGHSDEVASMLGPGDFVGGETAIALGLETEGVMCLAGAADAAEEHHLWLRCVRRLHQLLRLYLHDLVVLPTEAELFGVVEQVGGVAVLHALDEVGLAGVGGVVDHVDAGTVESHGVEAGEDADVADLGLLGTVNAVAVDGEVVGHGDV